MHEFGHKSENTAAQILGPGLQHAVDHSNPRAFTFREVSVSVGGPRSDFSVWKSIRLDEHSGRTRR